MWKEENMNKLVTIIVALMLTGTVALADNNMITSKINDCLLYTSPSPRDRSVSRMPSSA